MKNFSKISVFLLEVLLALAMAGCTLPISANLRQEANRNLLNFTQVADKPAAYVGNTVIWGGIIQNVRGTSEGKEIQILQSPLKSDESPDLETTGGEFIAITGEIRDLNILKKKERITIGGDIIGERIEDTQIEKLRYPVVLIKELYLWDRKKKWWEPRSSSGWFWELSGASPQSSPENWDQGRQEYKFW
jgi:outer membrane lipoprotein